MKEKDLIRSLFKNSNCYLESTEIDKLYNTIDACKSDLGSLTLEELIFDLTKLPKNILSEWISLSASFSNKTMLMSLQKYLIHNDIEFLLNYNLKLHALTNCQIKDLIKEFSIKSQSDFNQEVFFIFIKKYQINLPQLFSFYELFKLFNHQNPVFWEKIINIFFNPISFHKLSLKNPIFNPEIQNSLLYEQLKQTPILVCDYFLDKNVPDHFTTPPLIESNHPFFSQYLSWRTSYTINQLCFLLFGQNQKRFRKLITKHLTNFENNKKTINEGAWIFFKLTSTLITNPDEAFHYLRNFESITLAHEFKLEAIKIISLAKNNFHDNFKKNCHFFLNLFISNQNSLDIIKLELIKLIYKNWHHPLNFSKSLKSSDVGRAIADLTMEVDLINKTNFKLPFQNYILFLNNKNCLDLKVFIPQYHHDLLAIGENLHICVSNGSYSIKIYKEKSNLIILKNNNMVYGLVEIIKENNFWKILQAKKMFNQELDEKYYSSLLCLLNSSHLD